MTDTDPQARAQEAIDHTTSTDPYDVRRLLADDAAPDLLAVAHALRADADRIEKAHWMVDDGTWTPTEAAIYVAQTTTQGGYDTDSTHVDGLAPPADTQ